MAREAMVNVRLNAEEMDELDRARGDVSRAEWCRPLILQALAEQAEERIRRLRENGAQKRPASG